MTSFLMTEARQQNTEIRLSIGKVVDKVDQLSSKVGLLFSPVSSFGGGDVHWFPPPSFWQMDDLQQRSRLSAGVSSMPMETALILHNIQRILQVCADMSIACLL